MKKQEMGSCQSLATSPICKGWSSERIPQPSGFNDCVNRRKHLSTQTSPFYIGRAVPSKWEDAERWICSPFYGYGTATTGNHSQHPSRAHPPHFQRRPMSKSGPLLPPATASSSSFEFGVDGGVPVKRYFPDAGSSPFTTGVFIPYAIAGGRVGYAGESESPRFRVFSELINYTRDDERTISRRDMATQMSSDSGGESTVEGRSPSPPSIITIVEPKLENETKVDIREVEVDKRATIVNWSGRHESSSTADAPHDATSIDYRTWEISEAASDTSKIKREEAKIAAWENLQKAKAEAAIRKLEMKLEKKRVSSMDKIIRKLKTAQSKAKEMRTSITEEDVPTPKALPLSCAYKNSRFCMLYSCFSSKQL